MSTYIDFLITENVDDNVGLTQGISAPRVDGDTMPMSGDLLTETGQYAKVPFIIGDQEDEGTLFSLTQSNLTTGDELVAFLKEFYFPQADLATVQSLVDLYPDDPAAGSPYRTSIFNNLYGQFKRLAAILGDQLFTLQRRRTLKYNLLNAGAPAWTYLATYGYGTPVLGTFHFTDVLHGFGLLGDTNEKKLQHAYYLSFVNTLDPNNGTSAEYTTWPQWTDEGREILMMDTSEQYQVGKDDFREETYQFMLDNFGSTSA